MEFNMDVIRILRDFNREVDFAMNAAINGIMDLFQLLYIKA